MPTTYSVEEITPDVAEKHLALVPEHQRRQSPVLVRKYARLMEEGKWIEATPEPLVFDENGALVQGQHRLLAVVRSGAALRFTVARGASPEVFDVLDSGTSRQPGQMIKSHGFLKAGAARVIRALTGIAVTGSRAGRDNLATLPEVLSVYDEWQQELDALAPRVQIITSETKVNGSTLLGVLAIASRTPFADRIDGFLTGIETGADLSATDPRLHLLRRASRGKMSNSDENTSIIVKAWNAYVLRQPMGQLRYRANEAMPSIVGVTA